ncbi:MAG: hypothetical protein SFW36_19570, partial [Leptolyngbyaceae cyanobacterium bins.59]|nr:hypothetical protein [Leptolyngbyaceae cyanobacterium bins.59]
MLIRIIFWASLKGVWKNRPIQNNLMEKTAMKRERILVGQQVSIGVQRVQGWGWVLMLALLQGIEISQAIAQLPPPPSGDPRLGGSLPGMTSNPLLPPPPDSGGTLLSPTQLPLLPPPPDSGGMLLSPTQLPSIPPAQVQTLIQQQLGIDPSLLNQLFRLPGNLAAPLLPNPMGVPTQSILSGGGASLLPNALPLGAGGLQPQGIPAGLSPAGASTGLNPANAPGGGQMLPMVGGLRMEAPLGLLPGGPVQLEQVSGGNFVRITQAGSLLGLDIPLGTQQGGGNLASLRPTALPQLLTNGRVESASSVVVQNGQVRLVSSGGGTLPGGPGAALGGQLATTP